VIRNLPFPGSLSNLDLSPLEKRLVELIFSDSDMVDFSGIKKLLQQNLPKLRNFWDWWQKETVNELVDRNLITQESFVGVERITKDITIGYASISVLFLALTFMIQAFGTSILFSFIPVTLLAVAVIYF